MLISNLTSARIIALIAMLLAFMFLSFILIRYINKNKVNKEYKHYEDEKKYIPKMIEIYCHKKHRTNGHNLCEECEELKNYTLLRLDKCPFKKNKNFCNFCKVHCYKKDMKIKIKEVMKYSGPRMLIYHPIFTLKHFIQLIKYKKEKKTK